MRVQIVKKVNFIGEHNDRAFIRVKVKAAVPVMSYVTKNVCNYDYEYKNNTMSFTSLIMTFGLFHKSILTY